MKTNAIYTAQSIIVSQIKNYLQESNNHQDVSVFVCVPFNAKTPYLKIDQIEVNMSSMLSNTNAEVDFTLNCFFEQKSNKSCIDLMTTISQDITTILCNKKQDEVTITSCIPQNFNILELINKECWQGSLKIKCLISF